SADALVRSIPSFAGSAGPRRYFVAIENTAELRGTGGFIGNYAILSISRGRVKLSPFANSSALPDLPVRAIPPPSPQYARLYNAFGGAGFWLNLNMTPDAPTAARAIETLYQRAAGGRLDGVVFFDLEGLADLLRATGPITIPQLGATYTAANVVDSIASSSYLDAPVRDPFTEGPRLIAQAVWTRFFAGTDP